MGVKGVEGARVGLQGSGGPNCSLPTPSESLSRQTGLTGAMCVIKGPLTADDV